MPLLTDIHPSAGPVLSCFWMKDCGLSRVSHGSFPVGRQGLRQPKGGDPNPLIPRGDATMVRYGNGALESILLRVGGTPFPQCFKFFVTPNAPKSLAARADPQTPVGELTTYPRHPSCAEVGEREGKRGNVMRREGRGEGREGKGRAGKAFQMNTGVNFLLSFNWPGESDSKQWPWSTIVWIQTQ